MSVQNALAFVQKLEGDQTLQNQIKSLTPGDAVGLMSFVSGLGFEFTPQELQSALDQTGELTEDQLDQVAGGIIIVGGKPIGNANAILTGFLSPNIQGNINGGALNFRKAG